LSVSDTGFMSSQKTYRVRFRKSSYFTIILLVVAALGQISLLARRTELGALLVGTGPESPAIPRWGVVFVRLGVIGVLIVLAWFNYYLTRHTRLVVSPIGVQYYTFGYSISSSWDNVERIGSHPRISASQGLVLLQPNASPDKWFRALGLNLSHKSLRNTFIPLSKFLAQWVNDLLEQDIKRRAPHLFRYEAEPETPKTYRIIGRSSFYLIAVFFALIAIVTGMFLVRDFVMASSPGLVVVLFIFLGIGIASASAWAAYYQARYARLVVSPAGIQYYSFGYSVSSSWEGIECIDLRSGKGAEWGFVLRQPSAKPNERFGALGMMLMPQPPSDRFISLSLFTAYWLELEQDIGYYSPRLLESLSDDM
jgi:hypothetical protein